MYDFNTSIYLPIFLSVYISVYLSIYLSIYNNLYNMLKKFKTAETTTTEKIYNNLVKKLSLFNIYQILPQTDAMVMTVANK